VWVGEALLAVEDGGLRPELLITDMVMPGMSGKTLAERLRRTQPQLRVLYMSGYTDDSIMEGGMLAPGTAFLQKPFTIRELGAQLQAALRSRVNKSTA
jgi:DNA-binding response OmpR family regulator